jgi:hypothetical protein
LLGKEAGGLSASTISRLKEAWSDEHTRWSKRDLIDGVRESSQSWKELLLDLKRRGLAMAPELAVADGALGFWQAIEEVRLP